MLSQFTICIKSTMLRQVSVFNRKPWKELGRKFNYKFVYLYFTSWSWCNFRAAIGKENKTNQFQNPVSNINQ